MCASAVQITEVLDYSGRHARSPAVCDVSQGSARFACRRERDQFKLLVADLQSKLEQNGGLARLPMIHQHVDRILNTPAETRSPLSIKPPFRLRSPRRGSARLYMLISLRVICTPTSPLNKNLQNLEEVSDQLQENARRSVPTHCEGEQAGVQQKCQLQGRGGYSLDARVAGTNISGDIYAAVITGGLPESTTSPYHRLPGPIRAYRSLPEPTRGLPAPTGGYRSLPGPRYGWVAKPKFGRVRYSWCGACGFRV